MGTNRPGRLATGRNALIAVMVFVALSVAFFNLGPAPAVTEAAGAPLLDNRFAWSRDEMRGLMASLGNLWYVRRCDLSSANTGGYENASTRA